MLRDRFTEGMSHVAATVNVVTTDGPHGRTGLTVSSMCSVSADPPSLLICVNHSSNSCRIIEKNGIFCVNVLGDGQSHVADTFSGRRRSAHGDKFQCAAWDTLETGAPALKGALVVFDCRMKSLVRHGTHVIYIGDLVEIRRESSRNPLIYANRAYGTAFNHMSFPARPDDGAARTDPVSVGCFAALGSYLMPGLVRTFLNKTEDCTVEVREGDRDRLSRGLVSHELDLVLTYDMTIGDGLQTEILAETRPYVLLPAGHVLGRQETVPLKSLAAEPLVLLDVPPSGEYIESIFAGFGLSPRIEYASASLEMVRGMVGHGFGYSLLMTKPANNMTYDGAALISRPLTENVAGRNVIAAHNGRSSLSRSALAFLTHCREQLGPR